MPACRPHALVCRELTEVGASPGGPSSIGSCRQAKFVTSLAPSSQISIPLQEWESFLASSGCVVLQYFQGTLERARTTKREKKK